MSARPYLAPGLVVSKILNPLLMRLGLVPTLAVRGRASGELRKVPVNVLEVDGARYLVVPRGETQWARNLRAVGEGELRRRGRRERFSVVELPVEARPEVIAAYRERWESTTKALWKALPDSADHPVFRIEPPRAGHGAG